MKFGSSWGGKDAMTKKCIKKMNINSCVLHLFKTKSKYKKSRKLLILNLNIYNRIRPVNLIRLLGKFISIVIFLFLVVYYF